jgi:hypothetical protein
MKALTFSLVILIELISLPSLALPPAEDIPEEILRTEIILSARSPIDGKALSTSEYAQLQARLAQAPYTTELNSDTKHLILLLEIRKFLKTFTPF